MVLLFVKYRRDSRYEKENKQKKRRQIKSKIEQRIQQTNEEIQDIIVNRLNILLHSYVKTMKDKTANLSYIDSLF